MLFVLPEIFRFFLGESLTSLPSLCSDFLLPFKGTSPEKSEQVCLVLGFSLDNSFESPAASSYPDIQYLIKKPKVVLVRHLDTSEPDTASSLSNIQAPHGPQYSDTAGVGETVPQHGLEEIILRKRYRKCKVMS